MAVTAEIGGWRNGVNGHIAPRKTLTPHVRFTPKADMDQHGRDVCFVPKADSCSAAKSPLFDDPVGNGEQPILNILAKRSRIKLQCLREAPAPNTAMGLRGTRHSQQS